MENFGALTFSAVDAVTSQSRIWLQHLALLIRRLYLSGADSFILTICKISRWFLKKLDSICWYPKQRLDLLISQKRVIQFSWPLNSVIRFGRICWAIEWLDTDNVGELPCKMTVTMTWQLAIWIGYSYSFGIVGSKYWSDPNFGLSTGSDFRCSGFWTLGIQVLDFRILVWQAFWHSWDLLTQFRIWSTWFGLTTIWPTRFAWKFGQLYSFRLTWNGFNSGLSSCRSCNNVQS